MALGDERRNISRSWGGMRPASILRISSDSPDPRRSRSSGGVSGGMSIGLTAGTFSQQPQGGRRYNVDDTTSLEKHRSLSAMEAELQHWKDKTANSARDANHYEHELHRVKSEHIVVRQQLENIIRDLLEKQKNLSKEMRRLREEAAESDSALAAAREVQQLRRELEESQSREAETAEELSVVLEKLAKADTYIKTLSDEAVEYQLEIERLNAATAEAELKRKNEVKEKENKSPKSEELASKHKALMELWTELVTAALDCADGCDDVSRECDEFIDVIKEEQHRAGQKQNKIIGNSGRVETAAVKDLAGKTNPPQASVTFMSCKPTAAELGRLLQAFPAPQQQPDGDSSKKKNNVDSDNAAIWEGTTRVIARLLRGIQMALREAKDDVLVAGRAYAELCRQSRGVAGEIAELKSVCSEERAAAAALGKQLTETQHSLHAEKERADRLQTSLDETSDIMAEAAALAEERTSRLDKLLRENNALEEAVQVQRKSLRERDDAIAAAEQKSRTLQETMKREKEEWGTMHEELQRTRREAKTVQEERDTIRSQLCELEHNMQTYKEASQQTDVDCRYLRKCVEELQGKLTQAERDRETLRETVESAEWEKRQLRVQLDKLKRDGTNDIGSSGLYNSVYASSPPQWRKESSGEKKAEASSAEKYDVGSLPQSSQSTEPMDKVRYWEEKLQAITLSVSTSTPLFSTPPAPRKNEKSGLAEDLQLLTTNSATLASLAYGTSTPSQKRNVNNVVM